MSFEGKDIDGDFPAVLEIKTQILNLITGVLDILKEMKIKGKKENKVVENNKES